MWPPGRVRLLLCARAMTKQISSDWELTRGVLFELTGRKFPKKSTLNQRMKIAREGSGPLAHLVDSLKDPATLSSRHFAGTGFTLAQCTAALRTYLAARSSSKTRRHPYLPASSAVIPAASSVTDPPLSLPVSDSDDGFVPTACSEAHIAILAAQFYAELDSSAKAAHKQRLEIRKLTNDVAQITAKLETLTAMIEKTSRPGVKRSRELSGPGLVVNKKQKKLADKNKSPPPSEAEPEYEYSYSYSTNE